MLGGELFGPAIGDTINVDITVIDATGSKTEDATVLGNAAAALITAKLVELLDLPSVGIDGQPLSYRLHHKQMGRRISDHETLEAAGVQDGDALRVVAEIACP